MTCRGGSTAATHRSREEMTQMYWELCQKIPSTGDDVIRHTCIAMLCTIGACSPHERLRVAAARTAIRLMPQPGSPAR